MNSFLQKYCFWSKGKIQVNEYPIKGEIYSVERLEEYAAYLGSELKISQNSKLTKPLLPRMHDNCVQLLYAYRSLKEVIHRKESIAPAGEWLTDNFHIVEDQLRQIKNDLPPSFYNELPKLALGELTGYPRIYALALALVAHSDSQLGIDNIRRFILTFQTVSPLKIGELWALPITLRLVLIENLRRLAIQIIKDHKRRDEANQYFDQLFENVSNKLEFDELLHKLFESCHTDLEEDCAYIAQIAKRLRDQGPELWPVAEHLEKYLIKIDSTSEKCVQRSNQRQASSQVTVSNIITSMRFLSGQNWREFFESVSSVDRILEQDTIYKKMDFLTRDRYRYVIETIGKATGTNENEVATEVLKLAMDAQNHTLTDYRPRHVGYYLIDKGINEIEKRFNYKSKQKILNFSLRHPNLVYFGANSFFFILSCALPIGYSLLQTIDLSGLVFIFITILIPCSDFALALTNLLLTHTVKPKVLPKLDLSSGVPDNAKTMAVIPCLLSDFNVIQSLISKLEIHYLGNAEKNIYFGLLTDFVDAAHENRPEDDIFVQAVFDGISKLNQKYAGLEGDVFFLFHRRRKWNKYENLWMGEERKRGKIREFNGLLRGAKGLSFSIVTAPVSLLKSVRYVITLDADTQLPRDAARKLIGTILHPLNVPQFDKTLGRITAGHGILQPRIGISIESSSRTFFSKIFSGQTGIDPYTTAVSEVYQDLFDEGSYAGKGLYDVNAFEAALENRVPNNRVLSHDLFEGLYCRAAAVSDIEFLDDYPQCYQTYIARQHRWIRGDWQIGGWIFPYVKDAQGRCVRNTLPLISRWKILDNLRRSLVAPLTFLWFIAAALALPGHSSFWFSYILFMMLFPILAQLMIGTLILRLGSHKVLDFRFREQTKINLLQVSLHIVFLAHQSYIQIDAIIRALYRSFISKKKLLEWTSTAHVEKNTIHKKRQIWQQFWPVEFFLLGIGLVLYKDANHLFNLGAVFIIIWMSCPLVVGIINRKSIKKTKELDQNEVQFVRQIARRYWHYFEAFVGPFDHWLPPDNHQIFPHEVTAHRTSPTNIGLSILSLISAKDFGHIGTFEFVKNLNLTLDSLKKLERHNGHFLNWYDTQTLKPLNPKYVSTVDSGNLAGHLLAAKQACLEIPHEFVINNKILESLKDSLFIIENEINEMSIVSLPLMQKLNNCRRLLEPPSLNNYSDWSKLLKSLLTEFEIISITLKNTTSEIEVWINLSINQIKKAQNDINKAAPWTTDQFIALENKKNKFLVHELVKYEAIIKTLDCNVSMAKLLRSYENALSAIHEVTFDYPEFVDSLENAKAFINNVLNKSHDAAEFMEQTFMAMDFRFLIADNQKVFSIGYNISEDRFDQGVYDLLGSESRLASFVAIAKGDVTQEHWFRLGRQLVPTQKGRALVSWSASMFEYLMPLLVIKEYENTLLYETVHAVVDRQISYGKEHKVPWGVSEAGYNARDLQLNYQYGPFGVPGLGLKSGLGHDLVISPYSTLLAAMVNPKAALKNLKRLTNEKLLTRFGFYESIDYTPERVPQNQKYSIIQSFMAHHQGMGLVAMNNVLNNNIMQERFHRDPRVEATRLLLQEQIPQSVKLSPPNVPDIEMEILRQPSVDYLTRHYSIPQYETPRIQLLSNQIYSLMISTGGSGYSNCKDLAMTRWKVDATRDSWGSYLFIRDCTRKEALWSSTYLPLIKIPETYDVIFREDKVEFRRQDGEISTWTQILVAPEDNVEIRHMTLNNQSERPKIIELTSYLEPVLAPRANDLDHLAFSKLFIQMEYLPSKTTLLAHRRKRSSDDKDIYGLHTLVTDGKIISDIEYETDRALFIGRGRTLPNARALLEEKTLSNTCGATLDPIMSLRVKVLILAKSKVQVAYTTGMAFSKDRALELADRYHDIHSFERECKFAWIKSQVDMRHLNIDSITSYICQRMAERILFSESSSRTISHHRASHINVQSSLWKMGISGDLPIVAMRIRELRDIANVRNLLRCHEYLRTKGLKYDFIIINEHETTYLQRLQEELNQHIHSMGVQDWLNKSGGLFILRRDITSEKDISHIQSVARIFISADEPLIEQFRRRTILEKPAEQMVFRKNDKKDPMVPEKIRDLDYFNSFGGFSKNGQEYMIILKDGVWTPAPWANIIGNSRGFGFLISESGSGFTWSQNSQANRLTPWSNDPVSDPSGEIIYLRDDETGDIWTPTALPIRTEASYIITHGQGYTIFEHTNFGIATTMTVFVPKDDLIKISLLKLKNLTKRGRKITISSYIEWVLGTQREKTAPFLICNIDAETSAIFARNPHDNEYSNKVAFADFSNPKRTLTCDRKEFLGKNGDYKNPSALKMNRLSQKKETGQDPCALLQTSINLGPGEEIEMSFTLGQSDSIEEARALCLRYRSMEAVKTALLEIKLFWRKLNNTIQIKTPDPEMNILMNHWLLYQTLSCRYWSRTAFYQSGGAYGFRDQLQDCMALIYSAPEIAKEHILRASRHQFKEGDVQHWWHPPLGRGIRTRISDDLLWLPYVVSFYIKITNDRSILSETTFFLEADLLGPNAEDSYTIPRQSEESATIFEHCMRAIRYSLKLGEHGLPLIGSGDWNDGMNKVGILGKGESIWLGWFLYKVLEDFLPLCEGLAQEENRILFKGHMLKLQSALEQSGWDGQWYKRAYFDDGHVLGSASNKECKIDSISQSWAVLSNAADLDRSKLAMKSVNDLLIRDKSKLILLLAPPFNKAEHNPGYILGYVPGVRENGGQYTHAAIWAIMANAQLGHGNRAYELFKMLNPINHSSNEKDAKLYRVEPYVLAGDVYSGETLEGRGGWSWYTGSASWAYRAVLESLLGFHLQGNILRISPCIPDHWAEFEINYTLGKSKYLLQVKNPEGLCKGNVLMEMDGLTLEKGEVTLIDDGLNHKIVATLKADKDIKI